MYGRFTVGKKRTRRIAALLLSLLLTLPAPSALAAESALESASSASSQAPEGESSGEESAAQPAEESSAPESSQPAGEESQPGEGESSQEEPSSQEPSSSQEESSSQVPEDESTGEESGISMEDSQQETFASYPLLVVGGHEAYMSGEAGARFYPDRAMTRAEMAQVLYNLLASYPPVTGGSFSDVSDSAWYATAVNTLVELDVLSGYEDGTFRPNNAVTRAEFVTAVCKCFGSLSTGSAGFSDVSGHWAEGFINQAVAEDWISGFPDGTFRPDESIQRCQVTAILNKALERTGSGFAADAGTQEFVDVPSSHWAYEHIAEAADPVGSAIETGCTVRVTATNGLNLRSSASTSSSVVTVLSTGALLTVTSVESNGWLGVRTGSGRTGYVSGEFVEYVSGPTDTPDPEPEPDPDPDGFEVGQTVRVTAEPSLRLRSGPGTSYEAITSLATGVRLTITSVESNGWLGVETASGVEGYVHPDYVEVYTGGGGGGTATGATVSANSLTLAQYQSARLDGSVTSNLSAMEWTSSNSSVAYVGYTVPYGGNTEGAIVYGASPGTATLTFTDGAGATATCTVTVTAAESVRFAYSDENIIGVGDNFNLTAITDSSKTGVRFTIVGGPATGSWDTTSYTSESRVSSYGLPTNQVRVFTRSVSFGRAGTYTVRAYSQTSGGSWSTDYCEFTVMVTSSDIHSSTTTTESRRVSTEGLNIIADFEGSVPEIEDDVLASGNPTVGYGYVVPVNTTFYNNLTTSELFAQLVQIANETYSPAVENFRSTYNIKMNQAHFDALTSFVFNCGVGTLSSDYGFRRALLNAVDVSGFSGSAAGTVNVDDVDLGAAPVYSSASTASQQVTTLDIGATVTVTSVSSTRTSTKQEVWYQVSTSSGQVGWMPAGYVQLSGSWTRDLAWADSTVLANNFLQWNKAGGVQPGLVYRRLAECNIFFFGDYEKAMKANGYWGINYYGFNFPDECAQYDRRQ